MSIFNQDEWVRRAMHPHADAQQNDVNLVFQVSPRYRDLLNIRTKLKIELRECEAEIANFERDMVS